MADYYADSSALVKRHVYETGTAWMQALADPMTGNVIMTARVSMVEVYSALNRRLREAHLSLVDYAQLATDFATFCSTEYQLVELTATVVERSRLLLEHHPLRAYDAVHLSSALQVNDALRAANLPSLTFLAADIQLLTAAQAEGLITANPNDHP
jgi:predicted nucleic acid-binding protein